jgi:hypothetical protein
VKPLSWLCLFAFLAIILSGCGLGTPTVQSSQVKQFSTPTLIPLIPPTMPVPTLTQLSTHMLTETTTPTSTPMTTLTPRITLEPEQAYEMIKTLLTEPVDCPAPCFWGIEPGKTTAEEARDIFDHLGLQMASHTYEGSDFISIHQVLNSGLSIRVILTIQGNLVENIHIRISPEEQRVGVLRDWSAYSPEMLIERYGTPSKV